MFRTTLRSVLDCVLQSYYVRTIITVWEQGFLLYVPYCFVVLFYFPFRSILSPLYKRRNNNRCMKTKRKVSIDLYYRCVANVVDTSGARVAIELIDGSEEGDDLTMNTKLQRFLHPLDTLAPKLPQVSPHHVLSRGRGGGYIGGGGGRGGGAEGGGRRSWRRKRREEGERGRRGGVGGKERGEGRGRRGEEVCSHRVLAASLSLSYKGREEGRRRRKRRRKRRE